MKIGMGMKMGMRMKIGMGMGLVISAVLSSCAPVNILNTLTPSSSFDRTKNISFGSLERQTLDIYRTDRPKSGAPMLVFIHGGSWSEGNKDIYKFLAEGFTSSGYDVVVPNYRLYPVARYPDMIVDSAKAIAYMVKENPERNFVLMGHSAGGYNMLMTMLVPKYLRTENVSLCRKIVGGISLAAPTGIIPLSEEPYITIFPDRFTGLDAPLNNVNAPTPPIFLGNGAKDKTVYPQNAKALAQKITERGGVAKVKIYEDLNHIDMVKVISRLFDGGSTLKSDIIDFIDRLPNELDPQSVNGFCQ